MQNFHKLYRRPRGMYFDMTDKGEMVGSLRAAHSNACRTIVLLLVPMCGQDILHNSAGCFHAFGGFQET